MIRDILCPRCEAVVKTEETKTTNKPKRGGKLCQECKIVSLRIHSERMSKRNKSEKQRKVCSDNMKNNNPMFKKETRKKVSNIMKDKYANGEMKCILSEPYIRELRKEAGLSEEVRKRFSDRMKTNNPMFDHTSKSKMMSTFKRRVENGEIVYNHGPNHHLWKGNRQFSDLCRQLLYPIWTRKILDRDNYCCTICTSKKKLQVHHVKPLRFFIEETKKLNNIEVSIDTLDDKIRFNLAVEIVNKHKLEDGITVCSACHCEIDEKYHENKKN